MKSLITAPGAMGKSAAARAVAGNLGACFVDLAKLPIGSDSLTGLLTRVLGWGQAPRLVSALQEGKTSLVLDSLDEAQLAAGRIHFEAFLRNVAELVAGSAAARQIVVFGRRDTMESAYLALADLGVNAELATIAPLGYEQSIALLDLTLDSIVVRGAPYRIHRTHATPFASYRDGVLLSMANALGSEAENVASAWRETGSFLGYPPVLLVLAQNLVVDNPGAMQLGVKRGSQVHSRSARGALLREVVEGIMDRESEKVRTQLGSALGLDGDKAKLAVVYTREEQVIRILAYLTGSTMLVTQPAALDTSQRALYEEQIVTFVPDHPFLRGRTVENIVFEDYLHAFAVSAPLSGVQYQAGGPGYPFKVGPFYIHFLHAMAREVAEDGVTPAITEDLVDDLIKSYASGSVDPSPFVYTQRQSTAALMFAEQVDLVTRTLDEGSFLFFNLTNPTGVLVLTSPIARGVIAMREGGLSLRSDSEEISLGPGVFIAVHDLEIVGKRLTANASGDGSGGVLIVATGDVRHDADLKIVAHPADALGISWKSPWHQWVPYQKEAPGLDDRMDPNASWQVLFGLRRLLSVFHASVSDDPSVYGERLDRFAVGNNPVFQATLQGLLVLGVVAKEGSLYRLKLSRLAEFDVNYAALRGPRWSQTLAKLHSEVCKTGPVLPLVLPSEPETR